MSETKRNLVIRNGKYRLECINYEVTNVNFELMLYYDATNELIDKTWVHPPMLYSKFNPGKEYHIYTNKQMNIYSSHKYGSNKIL